MTTNTHLAWMIHKQWSGETSAKLKLFSRELGMVEAHYKGARSKKNQAFLEAFNPLWIGLDKRYDRHFVRSVESIDGPLILAGHALFSGLYVNELLYHALTLENPDESLFDAYQITIEHLGQAQEQRIIEAILRRFEWTLLKSCGYSFSWTHTADGACIDENVCYQFIAGRGFIEAEQGIVGAHILALAEDQLEKPEHLKSAKWVMRQAIDHLLGGRELKSRLLYL